MGGKYHTKRGKQAHSLQDTARISSTLIIPAKLCSAQCWVPCTVKVGIRKKTLNGWIVGKFKAEWKEDLQAKTAEVKQIVKSKEEETEEEKQLAESPLLVSVKRT